MNAPQPHSALRHTKRIAIVGEGPAALATTERLLAAGMCVDLFSARPAPFGFLQRFGNISSAAQAPAAATPRLRLIGNVRVGTEAGSHISPREIHTIAASSDPQLILLELHARGVTYTLFEGLYERLDDTQFTDWEDVITRAQLAPVCF